MSTSGGGGAWKSPSVLARREGHQHNLMRPGDLGIMKVQIRRHGDKVSGAEGLGAVHPGLAHQAPGDLLLTAETCHRLRWVPVRDGDGHRTLPLHLQHIPPLVQDTKNQRPSSHPMRGDPPVGIQGHRWEKAMIKVTAGW